MADPTAGMSERQKKLFQLQQRLKASRKANQTAVVQERRRKQAPEGSDVATEKRKWFEEKQKRKQADLDRLGIEEKDVCLSIFFPVPTRQFSILRTWIMK